jgi:hypothetical protein
VLYSLLKEIDFSLRNVDNCSFKYKIMPPRRRPLCDFNHDPRPEENSDERIPPPPPSSNDRTNPALTQLMAETTRQFAEVMAQISQLVVQFE